MKKALLILTAMASLAVSAHAQERTAGSSLDTQVTWTALSSRIDSAAARIDGVDSRVTQLVTCGKKGKVYAPGSTGRDADGCISAESDQTLINRIAECGKVGRIYNKVTNTCVSAYTDPAETTSNKPEVQTFGGYAASSAIERNLGTWDACFISRYTTIEGNHGCEVRQAGQTAFKGPNNSVGADVYNFIPKSNTAWVMSYQKTFCAATCIKFK